MSSERTKVMAFGTFDFFHAGHDYLLREAKKLGNYLIVVIARDRTVQLVKGATPENNEKARLQVVKNHPTVDKAVLGELEDKYSAIKKYHPQIIVLGYDQYVFTQQIKPTLIKNRINAKIVRLPAYRPEIYKSSLIKNTKWTLLFRAPIPF